MNASPSGLSVRNISCTRGYRDLFAGLDFDLQPGDILRVEGKNGTGKTSMLRILAGLAQPVAGDVLWNGKAIRDPDSCYFNDLLYLGHKPAIKFELTPIENLCMAQALFGSQQNNGLEEALYQVGLYGFEDVLAAHLSAGQKRRVALAQLFLSRAKLWILDEPYTSLDVVAIELLEGVFQNHVKNGGILVITSHQPVHIKESRMRRLVLPSTTVEEV